MSTSPRVALALGSGGARGYAHIGVVQELADRGFDIVTIAGSSMGALVGGLTAAGRIDDFAAWATRLTQRDVLRLMDPKWSAPGAITADRLLAEMADLFDGLQIEDLPIPFTAVATDLVARREVWFQRGPLRSAVRASIAIPGLFTPVMINGRLLVDGGLMNPIPIEPTAAVPVDLTIAVSLLGPRSPRESATPMIQTAAPQRFEEWRERLRKTVSSVTGRDEALPKEPAEDDSGMQALPADLRLTEVTGLSVEAMQGLVSRYRMAGLPPDVLISVPADAARTLDFHRATDMIELGRTVTDTALTAAGY